MIFFFFCNVIVIHILDL